MEKYRLNECWRIGCTLGSLGDSLAILSYVHANVAPSCGQQVSQPHFLKINEMWATQEHLEGVSQTFNQILHLRLEDESDADARLEKYRSVTPKSVMQNFS